MTPASIAPSVQRQRAVTLAMFLALSAVVMLSVAAAVIANIGWNSTGLRAGATAAAIILFKAAPAIAAITGGAMPVRQDLLARSLVLTAASITLMVVLLVTGVVTSAVPGLGAIDEVGIAAAFHALSAPDTPLEGPGTRYPLTDRRVVAVDAVLMIAHLLSPIALVGMAMGMVLWLDARVTFRARKDQWIAVVVLFVVVLPVIYTAFLALLRDAGTAVLFRPAPLHRMWVTAVPLFLPGLLGWYSLFSRSTRNT